jgi:hypothetical protein
MSAQISDSISPPLASLPNLFLFHPDNQKFVSGQSHQVILYSRTRVYAVWLAALLLLPLVVSSVAAWGGFSLLNRVGGTASASVIHRETVNDVGGAEYYVTYEYTISGNSYQHQQLVSERTYETSETGSQVGMIYLPLNPNISRLASNDRATLATSFYGVPVTLVDNFSVWVVPLLALPLVIAVIVTLARERRVHRLERNGVLLKGTVDNCCWTAEQGADGRHHSAQINYRCVVRGVCQLSGTKVVDLSRRKSQNLHLPVRGAPVALLYLDDTNFEVL